MSPIPSRRESWSPAVNLPSNRSDCLRPANVGGPALRRSSRRVFHGKHQPRRPQKHRKPQHSRRPQPPRRCVDTQFLWRPERAHAGHPTKRARREPTARHTRGLPARRFPDGWADNMTTPCPNTGHLHQAPHGLSQWRSHDPDAPRSRAPSSPYQCAESRILQAARRVRCADHGRHSRHVHPSRYARRPPHSNRQYRPNRSDYPSRPFASPRRSSAVSAPPPSAASKRRPMPPGATAFRRRTFRPAQALGKSPSSIVGVCMPSARISTIGFMNSRSR